MSCFPHFFQATKLGSLATSTCFHLFKGIKNDFILSRKFDCRLSCFPFILHIINIYLHLYLVVSYLFSTVSKLILKWVGCQLRFSLIDRRESEGCFFSNWVASPAPEFSSSLWEDFKFCHAISECSKGHRALPWKPLYKQFSFLAYLQKSYQKRGLWVKSEMGCDD